MNEEAFFYAEIRATVLDNIKRREEERRQARLAEEEAARQELLKPAGNLRRRMPRSI